MWAVWSAGCTAGRGVHVRSERSAGCTAVRMWPLRDSVLKQSHVASAELLRQRKNAGESCNGNLRRMPFRDENDVTHL